jgi:RecB family exonuclease
MSDDTTTLPKISLNQALTWDRCHFLWKLKYVDKYEKLRRGHKMELGNMGHAMLFDLYKTGQDHSADFANTWLEDIPSLDGEQIQNIATAVSMFKLYREMFSPQADKGLTTVELEFHFEVELVTPKGRHYILEGYIDRMSVDDRGLLWIEDYKWTTKFWSSLELLMDPQLPLYAAALRALGRPVHGCMVTQVNTYPYKGDNRSKKTIDELFKRERFAVSTDQTDALLYEYGRQMDEIIDAQESGEPLRRSLRRDCGGGTTYPCEMQEPCLMGLKGLDPVSFLAMSSDYQLKAPRPVDRQDGVAVPLQTRTRLPEITVDDQTIILT